MGLVMVVEGCCEGEAGGTVGVAGTFGFRGGGGMMPFGGPYCIIGLRVELVVGVGLGSLTAYMVASRT